MAAGFVTLAAARAAAQGADLETVLQAAYAVRAKVNLYVVFDTLKYLAMSGRIGRAASLLGAALQIKPIIYVNDNVVDVVAKPRTRSRALHRLLDEVEAQADGRPLHVAVMHADAAEEASALLKRIEDRFSCVETMITAFTPVMGVSTGPGVVGVSCYPDSEGEA